ncbi:MAG: autotransporter outer membrane beta-barrel domain-containing protein [Azospirillum sp.]|nr:autotransporter outer membrane beta-barrel domain-containing protein [Azospirillum sp.]
MGRSLRIAGLSLVLGLGVAFAGSGAVRANPGQCDSESAVGREALRILKSSIDVTRPGSSSGSYNGHTIVATVHPSTSSVCDTRRGDVITLAVDGVTVFSKAESEIGDAEAQAFLNAVNAGASTRVQNSASTVTSDVLRVTSQQIAGLIAGRIGAVVSLRPPAPGRSGAAGASGPTLPRVSGLHGGRFGSRPDSSAVAAVGPWRPAGRDGGYFSRGGSLSDLISLGSSVLDASGGLDGAGLDGLQVGGQGGRYSVAGTVDGLAAGDEPPRFGVWGTASYTNLHNTLSTTDTRGPLYTLIGGGDYKLTDAILVGTAVSFEMVDVETRFNDGSYFSRGVSVSPYAAYTVPQAWLGLDGVLAIDAMASYGRLSNETERDRSASRPIKAAFDGSRLLAAGNLNYLQAVEAWTLSGRIGYLWARQDTDAFAESNGTAVEADTSVLAQTRVGGKAARQFGDFEPYVGASYIYDLVARPASVAVDQVAPSDDRDEIEGVLGFNWTPSPDLIGSFEISHGFFRTDNQNTTLTLNLRGEF